MPRRKKEDTLFMMLWRKNEKLDSPILILLPKNFIYYPNSVKLFLKRGGGEFEEKKIYKS